MAADDYVEAFWSALPADARESAGEMMTFYETRLDLAVDSWVQGYDDNALIPPVVFYSMLVNELRNQSPTGEITEIDALHLCMQLTTAIYKMGAMQIMMREKGLDECLEETDVSQVNHEATKAMRNQLNNFFRKLWPGA